MHRQNSSAAAPLTTKGVLNMPFLFGFFRGEGTHAFAFVLSFAYTSIYFFLSLDIPLFHHPLRRQRGLAGAADAFAAGGPVLALRTRKIITSQDTSLLYNQSEGGEYR